MVCVLCGGGCESICGGVCGTCNAHLSEIFTMVMVFVGCILLGVFIYLFVLAVRYLVDVHQSNLLG